MTPNRMRIIDRWIGIPICAFASIMKKFLKKKSIQKNNIDPDIILFTCIAEIGALFVAYPALLKAKKNFPKSRILFLTGSGGVDALKIMGLHEEDILEIRTDSLYLLIKDCLRLKKKIGSNIFFNIVLEPFTRFSHLLGFWLGADRLVGCHSFNSEGGYLGSLITDPVVYNPHLHASQQFVALVEALNNKFCDIPSSKFKISNQTRFRARFHALPEEKFILKKKILQQCPSLKNKKIILLNANASDIVPLRKWPLASFVEVGKVLLSQRDDVGIILTGAKSERDACDQLVINLESSNVLNLAGDTSFRELLTLYELSVLLISNDSGPVHFASSTNISILALYGPETPSIFGPMTPSAKILYLGLSCSPCVSPMNQKKSECNDNQCMKKISTEWVSKEALKLIPK